MFSYLLYSILIVFSLTVMSCKEGSNKISKKPIRVEDAIHLPENDIIKDPIIVDDSLKPKLISGRSLIFYSLGKEEYNSLISRMGQDSKWEFDIIYKNFKTTADHTISALDTFNIVTKYSTEPIILFLSSKNDTLSFDRTNDDYFVGQIFFDGIDSIYVAEGLMNTKHLEELIKSRFNILTEFKIAPVIYISDSFGNLQSDTLEVMGLDSIHD